MTISFCWGDRSRHGTSRGRPVRLAYLPRTLRSYALDLPLQARIAPFSMDKLWSGITLFQSTPIVRPNPWQVGHAPTGDWYENSPARGGSNLRAHLGQTRPSRTDRVPFSVMIVAA